MNFIGRPALLAGILSAAIALFLWLRPSDEHRVRQLLYQCARLASSQGTEGELGRLTKVSQLAAHVTKDVRVRLDWLGGLRGGLDGRDSVRN